jgi:hypothetical protein
MTYPHSHHRNHQIYQHSSALSWYIPLVNAPVAPLDLRSGALIPTHRTEHGAGSPLVVDGEVITSIATIPDRPRYDTDATAVPIKRRRKRSLLRRVIEDPYWILMTMPVVLGVAITATVIYSAIQIMLTVAAWLDANGTTIAGLIILIILLMVCGGAKAAQCAGIHCGGCKR